MRRLPLLILMVPAWLLAAVAAPSDTVKASWSDTQVNAQANSSTVFPTGPQPSQAALPKDSLAVAPPKSRSDTVIVAKHAFDHREQIITGSVIMSCLVLMLVAMNNYNPR